ncbi:thiol reductant ABC exporter subunit CydD [Neobacillus dielmonensis]|uniref:thiol reductant ABC exporter subunit CydD n=1 Tax=Neobacillus dielmonensis TaxID=1347369 RepID=UPI0005A791AD|nr:thiol reductant ABC exporter subunit CydD [Neobacillus dielmonensis]
MDRALFTLKGIKPVLWKIGIITVLQSALIILQAYTLAEAISSLFRGDLLSSVFKNLALYLCALMFRQFFVVIKNNSAYHFAAQISDALRKSLVQKLFQLGPQYAGEEGTGQTVTLVMDGILKFRKYVELIMIKTINMLIIPMGIVIYSFWFHPRSAVILVAVMPILIAFMVLLGYAAKNKADQQFHSYQMLANHFIDSLRGLETLKYLGLSKQHVRNIKRVSENYRQATISTLKIAFLSTLAMDFFTMLSIATVAVFLGLGLINGSIQLAQALTILILAPEYFLPLREFGADYHATLDGKNAGKKMEAILMEKSLLQAKEEVPEWCPAREFSLQGVNVQFSDQQTAGLKEITFKVTGAKKIGIIGESGAGKSTLIKLLSGFIAPVCGEFQVNGKRISTLSAQDWQKQITYIPQKPYIFTDTILNNICFYHPEATEYEVSEAVKNAGLMELVQSFPNGLDTLIGEGGRSLSGGQEQRIAIARAFLAKRPIIMLDEPTAHLDIETEVELKDTMLRLFDSKLVFFATHRLHWMLDMDEIIVLDNGRIVETGTHSELMNKASAYYQLISAQKGEC